MQALHAPPPCLETTDEPTLGPSDVDAIFIVPPGLCPTVVSITLGVMCSVCSYVTLTVNYPEGETECVILQFYRPEHGSGFSYLPSSLAQF